MEFLPSFSVLTAFTLASLILTITPGPDMTLFLGRAVTQGRAAAMACMLGASTGVVVHTFFAAFGISALIQASPKGFLILKAFGAVYLLWLAIQAIRQGSTFTLKEEKTPETSLFNNWLTGIGINLLNPKMFVFFITFLPQFVSLDDANATAKILFLGFYFVIFAIICCTFIIYAVDRVAYTLKKNRTVTRIIDWTFAGVFSAFAIRILFIERG